MVKNVILDMGNVLLSFEPKIPLDAFCESEEQKQIIENELFNSPLWLEADRGLIKDAELFDLVKQNVAPEHHSALKQCCAHWDICMQPIDGAREFCRYVKSRGLGIYVLSNASDKFYDYFGSFLPFDFFDGVVVSSDIKMMKPDHEIFAYMMDKYQLNKSECLFIDDNLGNVEGARSFGMHAHQFQYDYEAIKEKYLL